MSENANVDAAKYDAMYAASIADPDAFWGSTANASIGSNRILRSKTSTMLWATYQ